jgi:GWxTD domain-containing protein
MSVSAFAALSQKYADWPKGPEQWLMTRDDVRAWKNITTDEQAQAFIDLFWARRDPTPGTLRNEFRDEFDGRVEYADRNYKSYKGKRGSLTEPGRVFILLGPPKFASNAGRQQLGANSGLDSLGQSALGGSAGGSASGGPAGIQDSGYKMSGQLGAKMEWEYDRPGDLGLTGHVTFIEDITSHDFHYDPQQGNIGGAISYALKRIIVSPNMTEVPEWAKPPHIEYRQVESGEPEPKQASAPGPTQTTTIVKRGGTTVETIVTPAGSPGAHDLSLIADSRAIKPQAEADPFGAMVKKTAFAKSDDVAFVFQYCRPAVDSVRTNLKFGILLSGKANGESVDIEVPEDETTTEPVKTMPGCSIVRGSIPGGSLQPGTYAFTIRITDASAGQSYNLAQNFTVE